MRTLYNDPLIFVNSILYHMYIYLSPYLVCETFLDAGRLDIDTKREAFARYLICCQNDKLYDAMYLTTTFM